MQGQSSFLSLNHREVFARFDLLSKQNANLTACRNQTVKKLSLVAPEELFFSVAETSRFRIEADVF